jgi:hypothetical protein
VFRRKFSGAKEGNSDGEIVSRKVIEILTGGDPYGDSDDRCRKISDGVPKAKLRCRFRRRL